MRFKAAPALALCLVLGLFCVATSIGWAADDAVGEAELNLIKSIITGALGKVVAFLVIFVGIYTIIKGKLVPGLVMIGLAIVLYMLPTFYNGLTIMFCPIAESLGGACADKTL